MKILGAIKKILAEAKAAENEGRAGLLERYLDLLKRARQADVEKVVALGAELGRSPQQVAFDCAVVADVLVLRAESKKGDALRPALEAAAAQRKELLVQISELKQAADRLEHDAAQLKAKIAVAARAGEAADGLAGRFEIAHPLRRDASAGPGPVSRSVLAAAREFGIEIPQGNAPLVTFSVPDYSVDATTAPVKAPLTRFGNALIERVAPLAAAEA